MKHSEIPFLSIIAPCYNEEAVIDIFLEKIFEVLERLGRSFEIVFVNDGTFLVMCIGILGEYVGRIYLEPRNRLIYIVEDEY